MKLTLSIKLYVATVGALILMLVFVSVNIYSNRVSHQALTEVFEHTVKPLLAVQSIDRRVQEVRFRIVAVITDQLPRAGARIHLKEARAVLVEQWKIFGETNHAVEPGETALIKKIEGGLAALPALFDKIDKFYETDDRKGLETLMEEDWPVVTEQVVKPLADLIATQAKQMGDTYAASAQLGQRLNLTVLSIFAISLIAMLVCAFLLVRSITRPVQEVRRALDDVAQGDLTVRTRVSSQDEIGDMAESVNATVIALSQTLSGVHVVADNLAATAASLSDEARTASDETGRQTDSVMHISAAMEELTVSVAEVSARAQDIAEASQRTSGIAHDSVTAVGDNAATTQRALQAVASSGTAVGELSTEIDKISDITKVIKEIADQTNLLALNAAIEAARAGETGRGFAVVADEVRKLAERTTLSTTDITRMIAAIQAKARTAVIAMDAVSADVQQGADQTHHLHESFTRILDAAEQLTQLAGEIANGTAEQTNVAQQTARTMESISQASERAGAAVGHVASTAVETARTAQELKALIARFKVA